MIYDALRIAKPANALSSNLHAGGKDIILGDYGPAWKLHRKLFMTALRRYITDIPLIERRVSDQACKLLQTFQAQNGNPFDPTETLAHSVADVICKITFGEGYDTSGGHVEKLLLLNIKTASKLDDAQTVLKLDFFPFIEYLPLPAFKRLIDLRDEMFDVLRKLLKEGEKKFDPSKPVEDLVSCLLQARHEATHTCAEEREALLSDEYFMNTMEDMFLAGYETTSTTLKWAIAFLVNYPEHQVDIQRQLDETVGHERMPSLDDQPSLPIIHAVIMETLRLGNVLPQALPHLTLRDTTLCGHRVPKGTVIVFDSEAVHLDPECWENPRKFDPYRHIDKDGNLITNQGNFYPFGAGRRACAGEALAKLELFLFLSWMLHTFTFVAGNDGPPVLKGLTGFVQYPQFYKIRAIKRDVLGVANDIHGSSSSCL